MQSPFNRGGFSCFSDTPVGMPPGGGVLLTVGVCSQGPMAVLPMGRWLLLRQHRTQPGTLDGDFWNIRVRWL